MIESNKAASQLLVTLRWVCWASFIANINVINMEEVQTFLMGFGVATCLIDDKAMKRKNWGEDLYMLWDRLLMPIGVKKIWIKIVVNITKGLYCKTDNKRKVKFDINSKKFWFQFVINCLIIFVFYQSSPMFLMEDR
jgi:hypothetical protein